jgi:hypothetical protein
MSDLSKNKNNIQDLQVSLNQATFDDGMAEYFLDIEATAETEDTIQEIGKSTENHQIVCGK